MKAEVGKLFWFTSTAYVLIAPVLYLFWGIEGFFGKESTLTILKDFAKTIAQTNISIGVGFAALLVALVTINNRVNTNVSIKDEFLSNTKSFVFFVFSNLSLLILNYSDIFSQSWFMLIVVILVNISLVAVAYTFVITAKKILTVT